MTKKILAMFLLLVLAVGFYAMTANAKGDGGAVDPTQTAQATITVTAGTCKVYTGMDNGTVNLRKCAGTSCAVLDIVTEGDVLTVTNGGAWLEVFTVESLHGFINSNYCKKER